MGKLRPTVLSIAGIDPSSGAGLLADIKTFEANRVYGLGIPSAITHQHDVTFKKVEWIPLFEMIEQVELLKERFHIKFIKIGLIENLNVMEQLVSYVSHSLPGAVVVWDPVLKASAGYNFHSTIDLQLVKQICKKIYLLTPNIPEALQLGATGTAIENVLELSKLCNIYLKGGHAAHEKGKDFLFTREGKKFALNPKQKNVPEKHGSGCVLSAAITASLAKEMKLHGACLSAKTYTSRFLSSNTTLLGYHKL
ncbi:MAG TPA: hydroxymethylpyrimidine/phosphomethylpyrimidine kinase [Bacteroidia bacterium]|jgi:hydroxymethylpyrimidine/phosphomethylpyrimidine kinase|nr:hydroxymethylpyrimidine/phosphomethylpyrimidine kinase [Bacteroidia bacterium]